MAAGAKGSVVQVIGTVVDIEFPPGNLPSVYNAVEIDKNGTMMIADNRALVTNSQSRRISGSVAAARSSSMSPQGRCATPSASASRARHGWHNSVSSWAAAAAKASRRPISGVRHDPSHGGMRRPWPANEQSRRGRRRGRTRRLARSRYGCTALVSATAFSCVFAMGRGCPTC